MNLSEPSNPIVEDRFAANTQVPRGFEFAGIRCGIKQSRLDLGLIVSETPATVAGRFTLNRVRAACVNRNADLLPNDKIRAIVVNSGNANAMTGKEGETDNQALVDCIAPVVGIPPQCLLTGSTGAIGVPLPTQLIADAAHTLAESLSRDPRKFAESIITTDTCTKIAHTEVTLPGTTTPIRLLGIAKGSGMIHPNMATTFGFVCTDAAIAPALLHRILGGAVEDTFNAITVDGDSSTNDMVLVLANGQSGAHVESEASIEAFTAALQAVLGSLARQVAADGEGATRLLEAEVRGAPTRDAAKAIARAICRSNLVKCSAFSGNPDWGRVGSAAGHAAADLGIRLDPNRLTISAQGVRLYDPEGPCPLTHGAKLERLLQQDRIHWLVDLGMGDHKFTAYGCDLTYDYVRINTDEDKQVQGPRDGGLFVRGTSLASYSPSLKHQLLVEGLGYVRRFTGLRVMLYLQPSATMSDKLTASFAHDLELCLDAGLKPLAVVPDKRTSDVIRKHMERCGHFAASVPPDPLTIASFLDRGHLSVLIREVPAPDAIVDLALKLGIQKLIALGNDSGLQDTQGFVQRLSPDTLLAGLERGRFDASNPDSLVLARHAATRGVPALHFVHAGVPHAVVGELFTSNGIGTLITRQAIA